MVAKSFFVSALFLVFCLSQESLYLTVAYPPNEFGNAGAVVKVDPTSGSWSLVGKFSWGHAVFGRPGDYDPIVRFDHSTGLMYLMFGNDFGFVEVLDVKQAKIVDSFKHSDPFFVGYTNFQVTPQSTALLGTAPVGNNDGEYSFGRLELKTHRYTNMSLIPFKAMMDDTDFLDSSSNTYFCQASYDQRKNPVCPGGSTLCMLQIDTTTGALRNTVPSNYTIYKIAQTQNPKTALSWVQGGPHNCNTTSGWRFAYVDLVTAKTSFVSCLEKDIIIQEQPWISDFNKAGTLFSTGSRYAQTTQLLTFDPKTGKKVMETSLQGLDQLLHPAEGFYYLWGISFL